MRKVKDRLISILKPSGKPNWLYHFIFTPTFQRDVRKLIKRNVSKDDIVLDIGSRTFQFTRYLDTKRLIGIDLISESNGELGWTDEIIKETNSENVNLCIANAEELPFPSSSIDKIIITEVLEHVENDVHAIIEISRVLKEKGKVLITVPSKDVPNTNPYHLRHYEIEKLTEMVKKYFRNVESRIKYPFITLHEKQYVCSNHRLRSLFYIYLNRLVNLIIGRFIKNVGYEIFVVGEEKLGDSHDPNEFRFVCPHCKNDLERIYEYIKCISCGRKYKYYKKTGIPILLTEAPHHQSTLRKP